MSDCFLIDRFRSAGSIPFALMTTPAAGVRRKSTRAFDATTSLAPAMMGRGEYDG